MKFRLHECRNIYQNLRIIEQKRSSHSDVTTSSYGDAQGIETPVPRHSWCMSAVAGASFIIFSWNVSMCFPQFFRTLVRVRLIPEIWGQLTYLYRCRDVLLQSFFFPLLWSLGNPPGDLAKRYSTKHRSPVFNRKVKFYVKSGLLPSSRDNSRLREAATQALLSYLCRFKRQVSFHWPVFSAIIPLPWLYSLEFCFVWEF